MTDLSKTVAPKSDQLNADDIMSAPLDITIGKVWGNQGAADQPISIGFHGDNGRPYKPCKSMRRVLIGLWGPDGNTYVGKRLRLYCDPNVQFGGIKVGGIRISHASHLQGPTPILLTTSRSKRQNFVVRPIEEVEERQQQQQQQREDPPQDQGGERQQQQQDQRRDQQQSQGESQSIDAEALIVKAKSTAQGGMDMYRVWFEGLSDEKRAILTDTKEKDPNDFDNERPIHEICKDVARKAD